jgi:hypothetical protein
MQSDLVGTQNGQYIFDFHSLSTTDRKKLRNYFVKMLNFVFFDSDAI